jgi:signal peptidase I
MTEKQPVSPPKATTDETKEFLRTVGWALAIAMLIRTLAFEPFNIPSGSMEPTLHIGDFLFVSKYSYGYSGVGTFFGAIETPGRVGGHTPQRGDVIVFKWPGDTSIDYIKRLIGLPGDTVQMRQGILYVNGTPVERDRLEAPIEDVGSVVPEGATDYLEHLPNGPSHIIRKLGDNMPLDDTKIFVVPPHHYFFMGDNRDNSLDSRAPNGHVGFVPEENLVGKAQMLFFSIGDDAHFWEIWKWPSSVRWHRLFSKVE